MVSLEDFKGYNVEPRSEIWITSSEFPDFGSHLVAFLNIVIEIIDYHRWSAFIIQDQIVDQQHAVNILYFSQFRYYIQGQCWDS